MSEPVAWRATDKGKTLLTDDTDFILKMWKHNGFKIEPLYLLRELTDEEILLVSKTVPIDADTYDLQEFARAILQKAREK
jgi:hypothetical protein